MFVSLSVLHFLCINYVVIDRANCVHLLGMFLIYFYCSFDAEGCRFLSELHTIESEESQLTNPFPFFSLVRSPLLQVFQGLYQVFVENLLLLGYSENYSNLLLN